jgi:hypothetical protein
MLKELLENLNDEQLLPKAFEKCRLILLWRTTEAARHLDAALLKRLEVTIFGEIFKRHKDEKKKCPLEKASCYGGG